MTSSIVRTPASTGRHAVRRRGIVLGRWPAELPVMLVGGFAAAGLCAVTFTVGWLLEAATPIPAEVAALQALVVSDPSWISLLARTVGYVGHLGVVLPAAAIVSFVARRRSGRWDLGALLFVVLGGATAITATTKLLTARARPDGSMITTFSSAFPSGHTVRAVAVYGLLVWLVLRLGRRVTATATATCALALVAATLVSRVVLAAHWPTDVIAGAVLGGAWLAVCLSLLQPTVRPLAPSTAIRPRSGTERPFVPERSPAAEPGFRPGTDDLDVASADLVASTER